MLSSSKTTVCDWTYVTLYDPNVRRINVLYSFWTNSLPKSTPMWHAGGRWCILHCPHVFVIPSDPPCRNCSHIIYVLLPCFFVFLLSWALCTPAVSCLYVAIVRILAYTKQFWWNDQISSLTSALLVRWYHTMRFLLLKASGCCKHTSMAVHTYTNPSRVLIHNDIILQLWCSVTFTRHSFLLGIGRFGELLYPEKKAIGCTELTHKSESMVGLYVKTNSILHDPIAQKYCRHLSRDDIGCFDRLCQFRELLSYNRHVRICIVVLDSGPKISLATSSRYFEAKKSWNSRLCICWDSFWAHNRHLGTCVYKSFTLWGQWKWCRALSYVRLSVGCPTRVG